MRLRLDQVVIDSRRPTELVRFWAVLLGGVAVDRAHGWAHVEVPGFPRLSFQPVPEPKSGKNRLHLDVEVDTGGIPEAVDRAVELGAAVVGSIVADEQALSRSCWIPSGTSSASSATDLTHEVR